MAALLAGVWACIACRGDGEAGPPPQSALAATKGAQKDFRKIHDVWVTHTEEERQKLVEPLRDFLRAHPDDDRARVARVYLAWLYVERGGLDDARQLAAATRTGARGAARDFATVVEAAILIREQKPEKALQLLEPLDGKLVSQEEQLLLGEQLVRAALAAGRWEMAIDHMTSWLANASAEDGDAVMSFVTRFLDRVTVEAKVDALRRLDRLSRKDGDDGSSLARAREWMRKTLWRDLTERTLATQRSDWAKILLDSGPPRLRVGEKGERLQHIAAGGTVSPSIAGRSVGLVLGVGNETVRRRSAEIASGMARSLGLPQSASRSDSVRLLTRDDAGEPDGVERALAGLAGEGASVLVGGIDESSARRASKYAERARIPLLLMVIPERPASETTHTFAVGASNGRVISVLTSALEKRGVSSVARVGEGGASCDANPTTAGQPRFPVGTWVRDRVDALLLLGSPACARDANNEARKAGIEPIVALGLDAAHLWSSLGKQGVSIRSGSFPGVGLGSVAPAPGRSDSPVTWWEALGHDAGRLAAAALRELPLERVDDRESVRALHDRARRALSMARAQLLTSAHRGFEGGHTLAREMDTVWK